MRAYCRHDLTVTCRPSVGVEGGRTGTTLLPFGGTEVGTGRNQLTLRRPCQRTCLCAPCGGHRQPLSCTPYGDRDSSKRTRIRVFGSFEVSIQSRIVEPYRVSGKLLS